MRELDLVLRRYVDERYDSASSEERAAFEQLLDLPDPELAGYLLGRTEPTDPALARLTQLLTRPVA